MSKKKAEKETTVQSPATMPVAAMVAFANAFVAVVLLKFGKLYDKLGFTKAELGSIAGSFGCLVLIMTLTINVASGHYIEPQKMPMAAFALDMAYAEEYDEDLYGEYEESEPCLDGVYVDGVYHARQVYAIVVNEEDIVFVRSNEDAEAVLDGIAKRHGTVGSQIINRWFLEDVEIIKREFQNAAPTFTIYEAVHYIAMGTSEPRTHIIQSGDTLGAIAIEHGISVALLEAMNPGLDPRRLRIGSEILLYEIKPFITVSFTERIVTEERIAFGTIFEDTADMYRGQTQVRIPGAHGRKTITTDINERKRYHSIDKCCVARNFGRAGFASYT